MKRRITRGLLFFGSLIAGMSVLGYLIYREGWDSIIGSLIDFGFWPFIGFVVLSLFNFVLYSWRWQLIVNAHLSKKDRLSLGRIYLHRMAGFAVSYLTPAAQVGGEPVRIGMLMSDGVSGKKATSAVALDITIELIAYITFIVAGVVLAIVTGVDQDGALIWVGVGLVAALAILFGFLLALARGQNIAARFVKATRLNKIKRLKGFTDWLTLTEKQMHTFVNGRTSLLIGVSGLAFLVIAFRVIEAFYIAYFFGVTLSFAQAFLIATLPGIALLLPVPAGVGVFEGGFAATFTVLGVPLAAVAFALIIRLRDALFIAIGSVHAIRQGGDWLTQHLAGKRESR
jgi:uncharacterized membrane protein YbhN (UPF0104 family)